MGLLRNLLAFDQKKDTPDLLSVIEQAVSRVEPLLKQTSHYPEAYRKPIVNALEYVSTLVLNVPGPIAVNFDSYAKDDYVHAIFPSIDSIPETFRTSVALQKYLRENYAGDELYALMMMRRCEKIILGMEWSGQFIQRDVTQHVVYFTSHTIVDPAPDEAQARDRVTLGFLNNLLDKVAKRVALRKVARQAQLQEMDFLKARLHVANAETHADLEKKLSDMLLSLQNTTRSLELDAYLDDFEAVLLKPEQFLYLNQSPITLDRMGIRRDRDGSAQNEPIIFSDLIGFDRRNWTVTMVHCRNIQSETFSERLEAAYRMLSI